MKNLQSVATTMGFSTLDGLMMGTRCGALDPGVILYLLQEKKYSPEDVSQMLYHNAGLKAVSGISSDMRQLQASNSPQAGEAIELYCYQAARQIAALLPGLGGLDALIFTGGIGENAASIREKITQLLQWIGSFSAHVIPTNEEIVIADACRQLLRARR